MLSDALQRLKETVGYRATATRLVIHKPVPKPEQGGKNGADAIPLELKVEVIHET